MNAKIFFILFVLVLLVGCAEKKAIEESKNQEGLEETEEEIDTGIDDIFGGEEEIEPPSLPS